MAIKVGDRLPNATFMTMTADGPKPQTTDEVFKGKKVVLFAVPGAFTPTCDKNHLPGFVTNADKIDVLADGSGDFAKALGLTVDLGARGLGTRSQRYSMIVEDGVVKTLNIEDAPGKADISGAENLLKGM